MTSIIFFIKCEIFLSKSLAFPPQICKLSLTSNKGSQPTKIRKVENITKTGKITAKLRDAVPVCLIVEGKEVKHYKNIELPDAIKEIEIRDFHFYIPQDAGSPSRSIIKKGHYRTYFRLRERK